MLIYNTTDTLYSTDYFLFSSVVGASCGGGLILNCEAKAGVSEGSRRAARWRGTDLISAGLDAGPDGLPRGEGALKVAERLRELQRLRNDALLLLVVAHLGVALREDGWRSVNAVRTGRLSQGRHGHSRSGGSPCGGGDPRSRSR